MIVTVYEDKNYYATEENVEINVELGVIILSNMIHYFEFLDNFKDKLLNGEVYKITCTTDNNKYLWWSLSAKRPLEIDEYGSQNFTFMINGQYGRKIFTIKYLKSNDGFYALNEKNSTSGSSYSLADLLIHKMCFENVNSDIAMCEFRPEETKKYDEYEKKLWERFKENFYNFPQIRMYEKPIEEQLLDSVANTLTANCNIALLKELGGKENKERKE